MTLIIGLNLSDKIYLAADSRVTQDDGSVDDNVLKVMPMWGECMHNQGRFDDNSIAVAVAGDVRLATFFYEKFIRALRQSELPSDIRALYATITQEKLLEWGKEWVAQGGEYKSCCIIFGGVCGERKKPFDKAKLERLLAAYQKNAEETESKIAEIEGLTITDPTMKLINEKLLKDAGKTVVQLIRESENPHISTPIETAIQRQLGYLEGLADSLIFCLEISISNGGLSLHKVQAEWGEFLARGTGGIKEGDLPDDLLAVLDLMPNKEKSKPHLMESGIIRSSVLDIARKNNINQIGGAVLSNILDKSGILFGGVHNDGTIQVGTNLVLVVTFNTYLNKKQTGNAQL